MSIFAKQALMAKHAYVAALLAGAAGVAGAQTTTTPPAGSEGGRGAPHSMHERGGHDQHDPAKMQAFMAKRQAELKAKLNITPEQEGSWSSFTAAMKPPAMGGMERPDRAEFDKLTTPERIDKMQTLRDKRQAAMNQTMNQRGEATKAFYSTLTPEQKKVFDAESLKFGHFHQQQQHQRQRG
jgi:protein CpxP